MVRIRTIQRVYPLTIYKSGPAASATNGGAGGSKPGALACRDATVTETG